MIVADVRHGSAHQRPCQLASAASWRSWQRTCSFYGLSSRAVKRAMRVGGPLRGHPVPPYDTPTVCGTTRHERGYSCGDPPGSDRLQQRGSGLCSAIACGRCACLAPGARRGARGPGTWDVLVLIDRMNDPEVGVAAGEVAPVVIEHQVLVTPLVMSMQRFSRCSSSRRGRWHSTRGGDPHMIGGIAVPR